MSVRSTSGDSPLRVTLSPFGDGLRQDRVAHAQHFAGVIVGLNELQHLGLSGPRRPPPHAHCPTLSRGVHVPRDALVTVLGETVTDLRPVLHGRRKRDSFGAAGWVLGRASGASGTTRGRDLRLPRRCARPGVGPDRGRRLGRGRAGGRQPLLARPSGAAPAPRLPRAGRPTARTRCEGGPGRAVAPTTMPGRPSRLSSPHRARRRRLPGESRSTSVTGRR